MKHKPINALAKLAAVFVLGLLMHSGAWAQSTSATSKPQGATPANQPVLMNPEAGNASDARRSSSAAPVIVDDKGSVQVTLRDERGNAKTEIVSRPEVNPDVDMKEGYQTWRKGFVKWMKYNPDYQNYMTAQEIALLESDVNLFSLYQQKYAISARSKSAK